MKLAEFKFRLTINPDISEEKLVQLVDECDDMTGNLYDYLYQMVGDVARKHSVTIEVANFS